MLVRSFQLFPRNVLPATFNTRVRRLRLSKLGLGARRCCRRRRCVSKRPFSGVSSAAASLVARQHLPPLAKVALILREIHAIPARE